MRYQTLITSAVSCILALTFSGCGQTDQAPEKSRPEERSTPTTTSDAALQVRPAAVPASAKEWSDIQKFIHHIWAIATNVGQAQKKLEVANTAFANKLDLNGIRNAEARHLVELDKARATLDRTYVPKVADRDGAAFVLKAYNNLKDLIMLERHQTEVVINALDNPDEMPPEQELGDMTRNINIKTGMTVMSLHRLYWTYGYKDKDFDEKNYSLKKGAKPSATVSFNRGS